MDEQSAAEAFARAWNRLDPEGLGALLAEDVRYASQNVFDELVGRNEVLAYLRGKMATVRRAGDTAQVHAEMGVTTYPSVRPCVLLAQGQRGRPTALALLEVTGGVVQRIDLCTVAPHPDSARRTGVYPS